ncbi:MAG: rhodanese-like domain-containing protein [Dehalococcoidales bacterium]|nr:rhodanese-like domain-containing protein [Dehalococcoidales bacterium]
MRTKPWMKVAATTGLALLLLSMLLLNACGGAEEVKQVEEKPVTTTVVEVSEFEVVKDAAAEYLTAPAGNMKASDLFMAIAEGDAPYIVSLRSATDYAKGHIPGAVNIAFGALATLPEDEEILVYCYTGQSASFAAALLGVLGYDVQNLLHGMSSWSTDPDVFVSRFSAEAQGDFKVETTANTATKTYDFPELENTTSTAEDAIIKAAVATVSPKYITASDLNIKIAEDEDMTIVSVRSAADYAAGHVPGAINIGLSSLVDNLDKLDPDSPVYVYCYTGHSAAQAASLLNLLGYDAYSLKFGMCSWTTDTAVNMNKCFDASTVQGYDTEK